MEQHTLLSAWAMMMAMIGALTWSLPKSQAPASVGCKLIFPIAITVPTPPPPKNVPCLWRAPNSVVRFTPVIVGPDDCTWEHCFEALPLSMQQILLDKPKPSRDTIHCALPAVVVPDSQYVFMPFELDRMPQFVGGEIAMMRFVRENLHWPQPDYCGKGTVVVQFTIGIDGCIADPAVLKDVGGKMGKAVVRMLYTMPAWLPGEVAGRAVKVRYTMPIRVHLE